LPGQHRKDAHLEPAVGEEPEGHAQSMGHKGETGDRAQQGFGEGRKRRVKPREARH
jgi:hypothetical protein